MATQVQNINGINLENGVEIPREFSIVADEPFELLGTKSAPNPLELLMAAFDACHGWIRCQRSGNGRHA